MYWLILVNLAIGFGGTWLATWVCFPDRTSIDYPSRRAQVAVALMLFVVVTAADWMTGRFA